MLPPLSQTDLISVENAIRLLDPQGEIVKLDVTRKTIHYSSKIKCWERGTHFTGTEEVVRAYWVAWLCTTGVYPLEALELERSYAYGSAGSAQLDIRVAQPEKAAEAYALIELKAPQDWGGVSDKRIRSQLFALTAEDPEAKVLSFSTLQVDGDGEVHLSGINIDRESGLTYAGWQRKKPYVSTFPINYNEPTSEPFKFGGPRDLNKSFTRVQLDRMRIELHNQLWGGSRDDNQIYAWLVRLFLTKIYDEKHTKSGDAYEFQVLFSGSQKETPTETFRRINECYHLAYARYINKEILHDEGLTQPLFSAEELQWVVETLQQVSLTHVAATTGDLLGGFFEAITRDGFKQSKGLFFTHYNIAVFMLEVLDLGELAAQKLSSNAHTNDRLPYVIDPSCGSGTFILAAMRTITARISKLRDEADTADLLDQLASKFPIDRPNEWAREFIYGIEKREDLTISTKVNMVLHRDGHTHVFNDDGLSSLSSLSDRHEDSKFRPLTKSVSYYGKPLAETFDVVVTNPPFSITLDSIVSSDLGSNFELAKDKNSENLFLERWYQLLKPGGRLAAVLPESFFSTTENQAARVFLYRHFHVRAVVSLPTNAFAPWTPTRTSILFASKKQPNEEKKWAKAYNEAFDTKDAARSKGLASIKKLVTPGATSSDQIDDHCSDLRAVLSQLKIVTDAAVTKDTPRSDLEAIRESLKSFNSEGSALNEALIKCPGSDYLGLMVDEVGFRRTKRAENAAPNDLFESFLPASVAGTPHPRRRVLNLNDIPDGWTLETSKAGTDALSILKAANLWA